MKIKIGVVQLYLSAPKNGIPKPVAELKCFAKTKLLKPGESELISMDITSEDLSSFDPEKSAWVAEAGQYIVNIGSSSEDSRQTASFELSNQQIVKTVSKSVIPKQKITIIEINE